jgi:hypothetical protein
MIGFIKKLFGGKPEEAAPVTNAAVEAANSAPYKIPEPAATTPIPLVAEVAPAAKKPSAKKPAAKKQQFAKKAPAKKKPASKPAV